MYKEVLRSIENIEIYPIISLLIFVLFFVAMLLWVIKVPKSYIDHMRSLPMEDDDIIKKEP
ncbi:cbb3-type cytochrome c oxidase subunit 3 [Algoriphagus halophilus]|uniref:Cbb3-type cytochrome oxidase component FixQ n=1 Tax=Algoriphagus halophilus TaxID=226505 RepID=A0A1N6EQ80_9BACT|nr:cytochrome C oxidase Cbb3 [Algoriphagus halophilus]SIN85249.1 hypothetical protein SAMN05444394_2383 [Algoriphagus halophilus]